MGFFDKLKSALTKTRDKVAAGLGFLGLRRSIDDSVIAELERTMLAADMGPSMTTTLISEVRAAWKAGTLQETPDVIPFLKRRIVALWPDEERAVRFATSGPTVILVVGINGSGKTTSVAKLAKWLQAQGKSVVLAAGDTFRAAAIEQLTIWAERCGVHLVKHKHGADPAAVAYEACEVAAARKADVILIDTAGRLHTQEHLMRELAKIQRVIQKRIPDAPHEVLIVLDATIGQNAITQARMFGQHVRLTGIMLAKLDGSAKGGVVVGIREQMQVPVKFIGVGETLDDLELFDPAAFVDALFKETPAA